MYIRNADNGKEVGSSNALPVSASVTSLPTVGFQGSGWSNSAVPALGNSNAIIFLYNYRISVFGNANAATTITVYVSQDNSNYYATSTNVVLAGAGDFHMSFETAAKYIRLQSSAAATITATIAGK